LRETNSYGSLDASVGLNGVKPAKYECHFSTKLRNFMHISLSINALCMNGRKETDNLTPSPWSGERKIS